jgi:uncharacterized membrane protein (DUF2068 family)
MRKGDKGIALIAIFKLLKALLLVGVGLGALNLIGREPSAALARAAAVVHVDPHGRIAQRIVGKLGVLSERQMAAIAFGTFAYAAIFLVEGCGLLARKRWAEWLTIVVTASFIPFEIWELAHHFSGAKVATLVVNAVILVYLIVRVRQRD